MTYTSTQIKSQRREYSGKKLYEAGVCIQEKCELFDKTRSDPVLQMARIFGCSDDNSKTSTFEIL